MGEEAEETGKGDREGLPEDYRSNEGESRRVIALRSHIKQLTTSISRIIS